MFSAWANIVVILLALILGGFIWLVIFIFGKAIFEDLLERITRKFKKKKKKEEDYYIY
jgi:ribulose 1,5-bisphosphate synthetase/thiazole synthase